jgi:phosphoribosyl 1,2-cyclic phosphate phosphodiesterase
VYASPATIEHILARFSYAFNPVHSGGGYPALALHPLQEQMDIGGLTVRSFTVMHGTVPIFGFKIGEFVYITDASGVPEESKALIKKCRLLIVNALREKPHPTHFSLAEACAFAGEVEAEKTYLTHLSHLVAHAAAEERLPENILLAYDGLTLEFEAEG